MLFMVVSMVDSPEDKDKAEKLYNKYHKLMRYIASKILKNQYDAEDALMAAWERILKNLDKISDISCQKTKSFVVIIIERVSIDILRRNKRVHNSEIAIEEYEQSPFFATEDKNLEGTEIRDAINKLDKEQAEILLLRYYQDLSVDKISDLLNISENAVYKRIERAKKALKEALEGGKHYD